MKSILHGIKSYYRELSHRSVCIEKMHLLTLGLSDKCTFRCAFCPYHSQFIKGKTQYRNEDIEFIKNMFIDSSRRVSLIDVEANGEFFCCRETIDLVEAFEGKINNLATNGVLLNDENIDFLDSIKRKIPGKITISINTPDRAFYKDIHSTNYELDDTLNNVRKLITVLRAGKPRKFPKIELSMVVMKSNINQMEEFAKIAMNLDVDLVRYIPLMSVPGMEQLCGTMKSGRRFDYRDERIEDIEDIFRSTFRKAMLLCNGRTNAFILTANGGQNKKNISECAEPFMHINLDGNGDYRPCCFSVNILGNIFDEGITDFYALMNSKKLIELRKYVIDNKLHPYCYGACCDYVKNVE